MINSDSDVQTQLMEMLVSAKLRIYPMMARVLVYSVLTDLHLDMRFYFSVKLWANNKYTPRQ